MNSIVRKIHTAYGIVQSYIRGWQSNQKILVIESDDWGTIRTSNQEAYDRLIHEGYDLHRSHMGLDSLETQEDLECLYQVLTKFKDKTGRSACITANVILTNPDFEKIKQSNFCEYYFLPVSESKSSKVKGKDLVNIWIEGLDRELFFPQYHGREHLRWWEWLEALRKGEPEVQKTFNLGMCGLPPLPSNNSVSFYGPVYLSDLKLNYPDVDVRSIIEQGAILFEKIFGFKSLSTIAPGYCWTDEIENVWSKLGIKYIQGEIFQRNGNENSRQSHYIGQFNHSGLIYLVRNCHFEPSTGKRKSVENCISQINTAFRFKKPAVISSHRVNFVGSISQLNRKENLDRLNQLLTTVMKLWPDVIFLSTPELGNLIQKDIFDEI
jgi:hypothetical protein